MTDSQRELAEYVARWAGWEPAPVYGLPDWWANEGGGADLEDILSDKSLAWQAEEELIEMCRNYSGPFRDCTGRYFATEVAEYVTGIQLQQECTRIEATHRALRAARGGE